MPIYEYRCENDHVFEVIQRMSDDPVTKCEECGAPVERVFHPVAVHFKGSGFYTTDYAAKTKAGAAAEGDSSKSEGSSGDSKGESKSSGESGSGGSSDSGSGSSSGSGDKPAKAASSKD